MPSAFRSAASSAFPIDPEAACGPNGSGGAAENATGAWAAASWFTNTVTWPWTRVVPGE